MNYAYDLQLPCPYDIMMQFTIWLSLVLATCSLNNTSMQLATNGRTNSFYKLRAIGNSTLCTLVAPVATRFVYSRVRCAAACMEVVGCDEFSVDGMTADGRQLCQLYESSHPLKQGDMTKCAGFRVSPFNEAFNGT